MANILPPGARGYLAGEESVRQQERHNLGTLAGLMQMEERRRAQLLDQQFRADLQALGPNPDQGALAQVFLKHDPKHALPIMQASADRKEREAERAAFTLERDAARAQEARDRAAQAASDREHLTRVAAGLRPEPQPLAPVVVEVADPADPTKAIKIDARTGRKIGDAVPKAPVEKPLPPKLQNDLIEKGQILDASERFTGTFKDEYGGFVSDAIGNAILTAERKNPFGQVTGRAQWWQDYELHQSVVRNKLFGSALTAPEIAAWEKSAVTPGMNAENIKANLARREQIERTALTRLARSSGVQYNKKTIEEAIGRPIPEKESGGANDPLGIR